MSQVLLWLGPLVIAAGVVCILLKNWSQVGSARWTRHLLGNQRAERYDNQMLNTGWGGLFVLPGAVLIVVGLSLTAAAVSYH